MDVQTEKPGIIRWLSALDDRKLISQLVSLKYSTTKQVKLSLNTEEKDVVDAALKSAEEGRVMSHEDVVINTRNKYPNLYHNKQ